MKTAVIGLGWWGKVIVKNLIKSRKINIVCGVDKDLSGLKEFAREYKIELRTSYESVLTDKNIDAVILATPNRLHHVHIIQAAKLGKQVFCEKPLSLSAKDAKDAIDICNKHNIILGLGHERRYETAMKSLFKHVSDGDIGKVLHVETNFSHDLFKVLNKDNWRFNPDDAPGGGFTARGIHLTDFMVHMFGRAKKVYSTMSSIAFDKPRIDTMSANIEFVSGITGIVSVSIATPFYGRYTVFGDKGWIEAREKNNFEHDDPGELVLRKQGRASIVSLHSHTNTVLENFESWYDAINGDKHYPITSEEMLANIEIFEAIVESGESGKVIDIL
ncbi:MAG: Gfo/Idh/MocA family oxidoreductase [Hyphomicrobiales bacterium]|nr:Gfo/Idh/MocA family oxidoreductase [Hyphomicrobiales bacterium]